MGVHPPPPAVSFRAPRLPEAIVRTDVPRVLCARLRTGELEAVDPAVGKGEYSGCGRGLRCAIG